MAFGTLIIALLMIALVGVLLAGVILMGTGGALNKKYSNRLMVARVSLQGLLLLMLAMMFASGKH